MQDELIITLLEKFNAGSLTELDFQDETSRLILRKESVSVMTGEKRTEVIAAAPVLEYPEKPAKISSGLNHSKGELIKSPIVATFYAAARPDTPAFVNPGTKVKAGETLCILEAMKMMNHLEAEFDCEILVVHAKSGDLVEYGQTLFEVKRL
jgi:acetyl-CoA carboxylase biotin carboxyl carrier protein